MNYTNKSFSVGAVDTTEYRDNWERTFRRQEQTPECRDGEHDACKFCQPNDTRLDAFHWCPKCVGPSGVLPTCVFTKDGMTFAAVYCEIHGEFWHDSDATDFCWCEK